MAYGCLNSIAKFSTVMALAIKCRALPINSIFMYASAALGDILRVRPDTNKEQGDLNVASFYMLACPVPRCQHADCRLKPSRSIS